MEFVMIVKENNNDCEGLKKVFKQVRISSRTESG